MQFYVSYFYQIRFFKPNMIPISTALWDPKWYHQNKGQDFIYQDKNGVYNGLRQPIFAPGPLCEHACRGIENCNSGDPNLCDFLRLYRLQLNLLDFDKDVLDYFTRLTTYLEEVKNISNPIFVLIVHEAPSNPCSERRVLQEYFAAHGIELNEWQKEDF